MCYDDNARPPDPPGAVSPAKGNDLTLAASDENLFAAYLAEPSQPRGINVLIYPDVRGLHQFYKELAMRFAEVGITALAIDYFGRTAGLSDRSDGFEFMPHVQQMTFDTFALDAKAALKYLHGRFGADTPTFALGFCMGGSLTLMTGTVAEFNFAGLVPFYAGMTRAFPPKGTVLDVAEQVRFPVLGLFGGADQGIPEEKVNELDAKLDAAGVDHTLIIYPGAPHSFFDRKAAEFAEQSADAWTRVLDFMSTQKMSVP